MPESLTKDLRHIEILRREGKLQEALEIINNIEKKQTLTPGDQLSLLISKGKILNMYQRYDETFKVGRLTYRLSQSLGKTNEMITSLLFKASSIFLGKADKALKYLLEAEKLLNSLSDVSSSYITRQKKNILFRKSWAHYYKGDLNKALEEALGCLELQEKFGSKSDIAYTLQLLGSTYSDKDEIDLAHDYASRSLTLFEELNDHVGRATTLGLLGYISLGKGNLNEAINYHKQNISPKAINILARVDSLRQLGIVYEMRGELEKALKYYRKVISLAERENFYGIFVGTQLSIGVTYFRKGEYDLAID
jgi:tetratricopeptide (TPR) repeat protein